MHRILCEVSGGITGHRVAYLKQRGVEVKFPTAAQAQTMANQLNEQANSHPYRTATYRYTVE